MDDFISIFLNDFKNFFIFYIIVNFISHFKNSLFSIILMNFIKLKKFYY